MAKRKKINKRVMILLIGFGVLIAAGAVAFFISRMEVDTGKLVVMAEKASRGGDHAGAADLYARAARQSENPEYWLLCARENLKLYEDQSLSKTKQGEKLTEAMKALQNAIRKDSKYREAQELICEIYWTSTKRANRGWSKFIEEADKLIEIGPEDTPKTTSLTIVAVTPRLLRPLPSGVP